VVKNQAHLQDPPPHRADLVGHLLLDLILVDLVLILVKDILVDQEPHLMVVDHHPDIHMVAPLVVHLVALLVASLVGPQTTVAPVDPPTVLALEDHLHTVALMVLDQVHMDLHLTEPWVDTLARVDHQCLEVPEVLRLVLQELPQHQDLQVLRVGQEVPASIVGQLQIYKSCRTQSMPWRRGV